MLFNRQSSQSYGMNVGLAFKRGLQLTDAPLARENRDTRAPFFSVG
jgi:hypothetical protein